MLEYIENKNQIIVIKTGFSQTHRHLKKIEENNMTELQKNKK